MLSTERKKQAQRKKQTTEEQKQVVSEPSKDASSKTVGEGTRSSRPLRVLFVLVPSH